MSSIDEQFIDFIVKSVVSNPDAVVVKRTIDEKGVLLELTVDPEDLGRVIGKRGATAQSLRTLLRALGTKNDARYNLKIVDNGEPRPEREARREDKAEDKSDDKTEDKPKKAKKTKKDEEPADIPLEDETDGVLAEKADEVEGDDVVSRTRRELADLDDLDV